MILDKLRALPFYPSRHRLQLAAESLNERLHGLDFTMPDRMEKRGRGDGTMYYASPEGIVRQLFERVDVSRFGRLLDVGCGKGYVLRAAAEYGFSAVGGVEYDEKLCRICRRNLRRLGLDGVSVACADAGGWDGYGDYDVFYFFNPFQADVMARVVARIREQCRGREILLIYYRPRYTEAIEAGGLFRCEAELHDEVKGYDARIYRGRMPDGGGTFSAAGASKAVTALLLFSDGGGGTMRQRRMPGRRPGRIESDTHHLTTQ